MRQTWHSATRCARERLVRALAVARRSGCSRCRARGRRGCGRSRRGPRGRAGRRAGTSARHHQRAIQRLAASRPRKIPPVSQAPAKVRGRGPSAPVTAESAGRRAEANERVASESGSRRPIDSVAGERRDQERDEQQVLQPEVRPPAVHLVVGPAAEPSRRPRRQLVQRAERADPAAEGAAEERRVSATITSAGARPAGSSHDEPRTDERRQRVELEQEARRGSGGSPRPSSGRASAKKKSRK